MDESFDPVHIPTPSPLLGAATSIFAPGSAYHDWTPL